MVPNGTLAALLPHAEELGLTPLAKVLLIQSPDDDWVDIDEVASLATALKTAVPALEVVVATDGSCGQGGHDAVLSDPALRNCILDFMD